MAMDGSQLGVTVRTRATGLLARLAHDLELAAPCASVKLEREEGGWNTEAHFAVRDLRVVGAVHRGVVDRSVLSASDKEEIERKIRREVLRGDEVVVQASGDGLAEACLQVKAPAGRQSLRTTLRAESADGRVHCVAGRCELSLVMLGVAEIKGPLGAFRVHDEVEVIFRMTVED